MSGWRDRIFSYEIVPALHSFLFSSAAPRSASENLGFPLANSRFSMDLSADWTSGCGSSRPTFCCSCRVSAALHVNMRAQEACWHVCTTGSCQAFAHIRVAQSAIVLTGAAPACRCDTSKPSRLHLAGIASQRLKKARRSRAERKNGRWGQVQDEILTRIRKVVS